MVSIYYKMLLLKLTITRSGGRLVEAYGQGVKNGRVTASIGSVFRVINSYQG